MLLMEATRSLLAQAEPLADSSIGVLNKMLCHPNRNVKDPILRSLPADSRLKEGIEFVRDEDWAWQASTANDWLEDHE
jgi:hypothetical protein